MLAAGSKAPDFQLPRFAGGEFSLGEALEKAPVLLVFFKASCTTCQFTMPFLERLFQGQRNGGNAPFQLVLISQEKDQTTHAFHAEFGITIPTLLDSIPGYPVSNAFQIKSVPSLFLIAADGIISEARTGFDRELLRDWASQSGVELYRADENVPAKQYG